MLKEVWELATGNEKGTPSRGQETERKADQGLEKDKSGSGLSRTICNDEKVLSKTVAIEQSRNSNLNFISFFKYKFK